MNLLLEEIFIVGVLPFTEYVMVYWIMIPLAGTGSSHDKSIVIKLGTPLRSRTSVGPVVKIS